MIHPRRSLRLAFAGTPQFAVPALDALCAAGHEVRGVFTQADRPAGRGRALRGSAVKQRAAQLRLPVYQPASFRPASARELLASLGVDALVVVAYGLVLPREILAVPPLGCLNIHASLLPRWRGAAPIQRAILAGDSVSGVTIMRMDEGLDTGPTLAARTTPIADRDTAESLSLRLARLGAELLCATLASLAEGLAREVPQPTTGISYAAKVEKSEALIDWLEDAAVIERKVRAFNPWPVAETRYRGAQLRIWEAEIAPAPAQEAPAGTVLGTSKAGIDVACGRGALRIRRLQSPGRKPLAAHEFANAQPLAGAQFSSA